MDEPRSAGLLIVLIVATLVSGFSQTAVAQEPDASAAYTDLAIDVPDFEPYEVEYASGSGRFFHQVRPFRLDGVDKISIINIIHMPNGVIVDSRGMDRATLRLDYMMTPYFAWGQEYAVAQFNGPHYEWLRVPLGGGEPTRLSGESEYGGFVGELGFSPSFAALLPLPTGTRFSMPVTQPRADGTVDAVLVTYEIVGRETLRLDSGLGCECWILEGDSNGSVTRFWVSREAPFVYRRHRDIDGPRDLVSDALSLRSFP